MVDPESIDARLEHLSDLLAESERIRSAAAGMRNILVHAYLEVDDDKVWNALEHLDDRRQFAAAVERVETEDG